MRDQQVLEQVFLRVFKDAEDQAQDASETNPFPAYLDDAEDTTNLAPFCPTSARRVLKALRMAGVCEKDRVLDLGSGDGRFCTAAAAVFSVARAVGVESQDHLVDLSNELASRVLGERASERRRQQLSFIQGDLLALPDTILRGDTWTVIVVYLLPDHTEKFAELLLYHYHRGARIISLVFNLNEIESLRLIAADEPDGIFVYGRSS